MSSTISEKHTFQFSLDHQILSEENRLEFSPQQEDSLGKMLLPSTPKHATLLDAREKMKKELEIIRKMQEDDFVESEVPKLERTVKKVLKEKHSPTSHSPLAKYAILNSAIRKTSF